MWSALEWSGIEHTVIHETGEGVSVDGVIVARLDDMPSRISYRLSLDAGYRVKRVELRHFSLDLDVADPTHRLTLEADGEGHWSGPDDRPWADFEGCIDVDISVTPYTNTLPIRRLGLEPGESQQIDVLWIRVPGMEIRRERQEYSCLEWGENGGRFRYRSLGTGYENEILVDHNGVVIDYPDLFERIWPGSR